MRENCTSGIAPGAPGNRRSYGGGDRSNAMIKREEKSAAIEISSWPKCGVLGRNHQPPER